MKWFLPFLTTLLFLTGARSVDAGSTQEAARAAFKNGVALFQEGAYSEAAKAFRRANELNPKWTILFNIAQSEAAARHYGIAYEAFEEYLSKGGDDISDKRRNEVLAELDRLTALIGSVEVQAPNGSVVWVDGNNRGTVPLPGKLLVAVGVVHTIKITLDGQTIHTERIKVIRGESVNVSAKQDEGVDITADVPRPIESDTASGAANETASDESEGKMDTKTLIGWISIGSGGAFLVGGGVTGSLALVRNRELEERCPDNVCPESEKGYSMGRDLLALSSTILLSIGGAAVATGLVMLILSKKERAEERDDRAALSVGPIFSVELAGLSITGRF